MGHIELRELVDDDPKSISRAPFTRAEAADRAEFDEWMLRQRATDDARMFVVTEDGDFAGAAGSFAIDGDREVTYWVAHHARGRGVATQALRLLISREPVRPLYARVAPTDAASIAVLERVGFTEVSGAVSLAPDLRQDAEERVYVLAPVLE